tara:strand:- start:520 stop:984 length:465 start_codon:yes stop_codon:yes gene_type:complete
MVECIFIYNTTTIINITIYDFIFIKNKRNKKYKSKLLVSEEKQMNDNNNNMEANTLNIYRKSMEENNQNSKPIQSTIEFSLQRLDTVATFLLNEMDKEDSGENNRLKKAELNQMYYDINNVIDLLRVEFLKRKFNLNPEDIKNRLSNSRGETNE